jgi:hypothetical protein
MIVAIVVMLNILELIMELLPNYPTNAKGKNLNLLAIQPKSFPQQQV